MVETYLHTIDNGDVEFTFTEIQYSAHSGAGESAEKYRCVICNRTWWLDKSSKKNIKLGTYTLLKQKGHETN
jgi:hypothetical protein